MAGEDLKESRGLETELVKSHEEWAEKLMLSMWVLAVVTAVAFWALPHVTRLVGGRNREARLAALEKPFMIVLPAVAVLVLVLVFLTGDAGSRAVWSAGS